MGTHTYRTQGEGRGRPLRRRLGECPEAPTSTRDSHSLRATRFSLTVDRIDRRRPESLGLGDPARAVVQCTTFERVHSVVPDILQRGISFIF